MSAKDCKCLEFRQQICLVHSAQGSMNNCQMNGCTNKLNSTLLLWQMVNTELYVPGSLVLGQVLNMCQNARLAMHQELALKYPYLGFAVLLILQRDTLPRNPAGYRILMVTVSTWVIITLLTLVAFGDFYLQKTESQQLLSFPWAKLKVLMKKEEEGPCQWPSEGPLPICVWRTWD